MKGSSRAGLILSLVLILMAGLPVRADTPVLPVDPGRQGGITVHGEVVSGTSSNPGLVTVDGPNPLNPRVLNITCAAKKGAAVVTVKWKDAAGREQTTAVVVACGIAIEKSVDLSGQTDTAVRLDAPDLKQPGAKVCTDVLDGPTVTATSGGGDDPIYCADINVVPRENLDTDAGALFSTFSKEGTYITLVTIRQPDGTIRYWIVTYVVVPKKAAQLPVAPNAIPAAVQIPCPPPLRNNAALSGTRTPAEYASSAYGTQAGALQAAGVTAISQYVCSNPSAPTRLWNLIAHAATVQPRTAALTLQATPMPTGEAMWRAFTAVTALLKARTRNAREVPINGLGDQGAGITASFTLSSGEENHLIFYVGRVGNVVYWVLGQGQVGSIARSLPDSTIFPVAERVKANLEAAARR